MHSRCTACIVKSSHCPPHDPECSREAHAVLWIVQPPRRTAWMWQRDEHSLAFDAARTDDLAEWDLAPDALDRKRTDEQDHSRSHECELRVEPRLAQQDLGRRRTPIP